MARPHVTPNQKEILYAQSSASGNAVAATQTNGGLDVNIVGTSSSLTTSATPTVSSVASSATTVTLLAANTARRMATFYNDSTQVLYLKLGATASATSNTIQMAAGSYYELPQPVYTGIIDGIWAAANGNVRLTEIV